MKVKVTSLEREIDSFLSENDEVDDHEMLVDRLLRRFGDAAVDQKGEIVPEFWFNLVDRSNKLRDTKLIGDLNRINRLVICVLILPIVLTWLGWINMSLFVRDIAFYLIAAEAVGLLIRGTWHTIKGTGSKAIAVYLIWAIALGVVAFIYNPQMLLKLNYH
ncbi:hypothetical protein SAMN05216327_11861 [Dyadobacter sp. SG02]|uniref:hypothetical protein n=1 Tax=Dyadobacter sp. SG02 TaxID=1855291 RepID=UPI0008C091C7|nr:hypothetical protein [Dyadobacter sp. SG02]SEJ74849.1 hypothetical protein SAMN05216327_11861 [Dyadobacter sp. SG02]